MQSGTVSKAIRITCALLLSALLCGVGGWLFLTGLEFVTTLRLHDSRWFWFAPVAGLLTGWVFEHRHLAPAHGSLLLVSIVRQPHPRSTALELVSAALAPLIVLFTWLSHLAGLSVGREGTAIQLGGGAAAFAGRLTGITDERSVRLVLMAGMAAGFAAVFHVPLAAAIFALEVSHSRFTMTGARGREKALSARLPAVAALRALIICFASASIADLLASWLGASHLSFPPFPAHALLSINGLCTLVAGGLAFGLIAWLFLLVVHLFKTVWASLVKPAWLRPAIGGLVFSAMAWAPQEMGRYAGLGGREIVGALSTSTPLWDWCGKFALTVFSLGTGFKGGEVTPLFFMGASFGSALAGAVGLEPAALGALGFVAVFSAAAEVPVTCAVMAAELFGPSALPLAYIVCLIANWVCRHSRLYDAKPEL